MSRASQHLILVFLESAGNHNRELRGGFLAIHFDGDLNLRVGVVSESLEVEAVALVLVRQIRVRAAQGVARRCRRACGACVCTSGRPREVGGVPRQRDRPVGSLVAVLQP